MRALTLAARVGPILFLSLALVLVIPPALGHAPATDTDPQPTAFEDATCVPTCTVHATNTGNPPVVTTVAPGNNVTWESLDGNPHSAHSDIPEEHKPGTLAGGASPAYDGCLQLFFSETHPGTATFLAHNGMLHVDQDERDEPVACTEAIALPGDGWLLSYHCSIHPQFQHALVHVLPPGSNV